MKHLHPGARWQFRIASYFVLIFIMLFVVVFSASTFSAIFDLTGTNMFIIFLIAFLLYIFLIIIFGEIYARLAYNNWKYEFNPTELKIERGIIFKNYKSVPYQRVQNVDIHRGILARMLGFSTLAIQTAGYSGGYQGRGGIRAEGLIPAVSIQEAEDKREFLMKKIGKKSGL